MRLVWKVTRITVEAALQNITLQNVNLIGTFTSDVQVIENLLKQGNLVADAGWRMSPRRRGRSCAIRPNVN